MGISTTREALLAELMQDVDGLISRFEAFDKDFGATIEQATKDAAGKAFLASRLSFETMISGQERKLTDAGLNAASKIAGQFNSGLTQMVAVNESLERKAWRFIAVFAAIAVIGGAVGGVVVVKMLGV
ncbi:hypothetical protein LT85_p051 (plasmid) [Collimonas arenae]|uniref:Uncharacterized protein n=1 Tax=Collimonas arenae TaxID=279058 RepID=A0A0A1FKJ3_9BURK|nr:hypothetical protein [Collimonas arenae]AIY44230.1 hypothetical protein LT85_p051 [Collimonas arenae]